MSQQYILERTLPNGAVKTQGPTSRREACGLAAYVLTDNGVTTKAVALRVARALDLAPTGNQVGKGGYLFRLVESP